MTTGRRQQGPGLMGPAICLLIVAGLIAVWWSHHSVKGGPTVASISRLWTTKVPAVRHAGPKGVYTSYCGELDTPKVLANVLIIEAVAKADHVSPELAVADAIQESCLNPDAVGDRGCSIGDFQLNACGGEGDGMTVAEREDPWRNAETALPHFRAEESVYSDPGWQAAAAQNPANKPQYAQAVDGFLPDAATLLEDAHTQ